MSTLSAPNQPLVQAAPAGTFWDTLNSAGDFFGKVLGTATEFNQAKASIDLEKEGMEIQSQKGYAELLREQTAAKNAADSNSQNNWPLIVAGGIAAVAGLILVIK